ncbi:MAG: prepilin-type N-terminal cleavage/methylation domain-containing protein [Magnetococcales bacterium]|nr:prepilin-type N-terminal cleavage/methylation domain-containing protein [Magnetococcales bacterium]MBF0321517.1 prepilin-type N-terminal cleavage/methylation domain-containing protein [Magnetococcales bacterium]
MTRHHGGKTGFTLIEMVITITIMGIFLGVAGRMTAGVYSAYTANMYLNPLPSKAKAAMERIIRELRSATAASVTQPTGSGSIQFTNDQGTTILLNQTGSPVTTVFMNSVALVEDVAQNSLQFTWDTTKNLVTINFTMQVVMRGLGGSTITVPFRTAVYVRN